MTEEFTHRVLATQDTLYRIATTILPLPCNQEDAVQSAIERALRRRRHEIPAVELPERETASDARPDIYRCFTALERRYRLPMLLYYVAGYNRADSAPAQRNRQIPAAPEAAAPAADHRTGEGRTMPPHPTANHVRRHPGPAFPTGWSRSWPPAGPSRPPPCTA